MPVHRLSSNEVAFKPRQSPNRAPEAGRGRLSFPIARRGGTATQSLTRRDLLQGRPLTPTNGASSRARAIADHVLPQRQVGAPTLPPLSVIAFNRMGFGPRPGDWTMWQGLGANDEARFQAYVNQQLSPASIDDSACDARIAAGGFVILNKSLRQLWQDHVIDNPGDYAWYVRPADETYHATWLRAIYSKRQLLEVLADFWHNHFNVYAFDQAAPVFVHHDRDAIRANALGNFRTLVEAVGSGTAMLFYLDNVYSSDGGPNENYARELL